MPMTGSRFNRADPEFSICQMKNSHLILLQWEFEIDLSALAFWEETTDGRARPLVVTLLKSKKDGTDWDPCHLKSILECLGRLRLFHERIFCGIRDRRIE